MRRSPKKITALLFALTLALVPFAKSSAAAGGTIAGTVTDQKGAVVVGASVSVTDAAGQPAHAPVQTDAQGRYRVEGLPAGTYVVTVTFKGFKDARREQLTVV
ncbi:MAG TPA: carboxypeptidase-like regulatory domain-containing protein, partial [Pyrinomonadaceae bacterium]|nr:carboxypeptidase-like regulatory domain-containing protein [Pyrinomonadaceae bacterium]